MVQKVGEALNTPRKSIKGSRIIVLRSAYKMNVDDTRESPSLTIIGMFMNKGADVQYSDPYLPEVPKTRKFNFDFKSVVILTENIKSFDIIVLATDHDNFDYNLINSEAKLIIDFRGIFKILGKVFTA